MKKIIKYLLFCFILSFAFVGKQTYACLSAPTINTKNQDCKIGFDVGKFDGTIISQKLIESQNTCQFTDNDIIVIKDYLVNGYSVKEQTEEEYIKFLNDAQEINNKGECGTIYEAISHKDRWTGVAEDQRFKDKNNKQCAVPKCSNGITINKLWNDLKESKFESNTLSKKPTKSLFIISAISGVILFVIAIIAISYYKKHNKLMK